MKKKKHQKNHQKRPFLKRGEGLKRFQKGNNAFIPKNKTKKKTTTTTAASTKISTNQNRNKIGKIINGIIYNSMYCLLINVPVVVVLYILLGDSYILILTVLSL